MAQWVSDMFGGRPQGRMVSSRSRGGGGGGRSRGQQQAYDARMRRENQAMLSQYQTQMQGQWDSANTANENRYNQLIASVGGLQGNVVGQGGTFDQMQALMQGMGTAGKARIASAQTKNQAKSTQSLTGRGLGNTTIVDTANRGIASDAERSYQALDEQVAGMQAGVLGQKAGAQQNIGRLMADSILSRQDVGPNQDMYAQLISQMFSA